MEYWLGVITALITCTLTGLFLNTPPVEVPMIEHCAVYESKLQSYDTFSFDCSNGAMFDRDILED